MSYPAGAPLPSSKITLIIFDDGILRGIIPIYLENKSLSKSLVRVISLTLYKFSNTRIENLYSSYSLKDWNILEFSNKQVFLSLRKRVDYSANKYIYELPFKISNAIILVSSEDIENQFMFNAVILNDFVVVKRWPATILVLGNNIVNIIIMAQKE